MATIKPVKPGTNTPPADQAQPATTRKLAGTNGNATIRTTRGRELNENATTRTTRALNDNATTRTTRGRELNENVGTRITR
jgi:hypothetical protein